MNTRVLFRTPYFRGYARKPNRIPACRQVTEVIGLFIESTGPTASVGDVCIIENKGARVGQAEVVGFRKNRTLLMPLGPIEGIHPGLTVTGTKKPLMVAVGKNLKGRIVSGLGEPLD